MEGTNLYHLGIDAASVDFPLEFGDVKFICIGGSAVRSKEFAQSLSKQFYGEKGELRNISAKSDRYVMYKVGPILVINHGIGEASLTVMLYELFKLLEFAQCSDPLVIRIGTCGGLGIPPGTVIITNKTYDGFLNESHEIAILGERVKLTPKFDSSTTRELVACLRDSDNFAIMEGATLATNDFYYAQGRTDGPFQLYTKEESSRFLKSLADYGIKNIEMEASTLGGLCGLAKIRCVVVCSSLVDRYRDSQITSTKTDLKSYYNNGYAVVTRFLAKSLNICQDSVV